MTSSRLCLYKILFVGYVLTLIVACAPGASLQKEPPALQRGVAQGVVVDEYKQFDALQQYGIFIADSREGTHVILPGDKLFIRTVPNVVIQPDFYVALNELAYILKAYPKISVSVIGHTSNTMSERMQLEVSYNEARTVSDYLMTAGVSGGRIDRVAGVGDRQPIAENDFAGRQVNRRVEVIVHAPLK